MDQAYLTPNPLGMIIIAGVCIAFFVVFMAISLTITRSKPTRPMKAVKMPRTNRYYTDFPYIDIEEDLGD